jgi:tetraprenyl-beta-curcumene synthase
MDYAPSRPRSRGRRRRPAYLLEALALLRVQLPYWLRIYPQARRELAAWERRATRMPHGMPRELALGKLAGEGLNAEGAALFAVLAPARQRPRVVRLLVAFQVLYDYLDALNEQPAFADLRTGRQLHLALTDAVLPNQPMSDYYGDSSEVRDGGYVQALTGECRRLVRTLPAAEACRDALVRATRRCAEAQSRNHASLLLGESPLIQWSVTQSADGGDGLWWELAAGGVSSLAVHALLASAANPACTSKDARELDAAYFPAICALSTLLDSLADYHRDARTANRSFVSYYRDADHAAERLVAIAARAGERIKAVRDSRTHAIILAAIVAYYLSSDSTQDGFPAVAAKSLMRHAGPVAVPMLAAMRARRRIQRGASRTTRGRRGHRRTRLQVDTPVTHEAQGARARGRR